MTHLSWRLQRLTSSYVIFDDDVSSFSECDMCEKSSVSEFVYLHDRRLRQGRPRLSTVSNLREDRSETTILFDHETLIRKHTATMPPVHTYISKF